MGTLQLLEINCETTNSDMDPRNNIKEIRTLMKLLIRKNAAYNFFFTRIYHPENQLCPHCRSRMYLIHRKGLSNKLRCRSCKREVSIFFKTIFYKSKVPFHRLLFLLFLVWLEIPQYFLVRLGGVDRHTAGYWQAIYRVVLNRSFYENPIRLGGEGKRVQIDEALIRKRKYNRGRSKKQIWVFGAVEEGDSEQHPLFITRVESRSAWTLIPLIYEHILPGTTIISDEWRAYSCLAILGYNHLTVNHSDHFVDPSTGACTNLIESIWAKLRRSFPVTGIKERFIDDYICSFVEKKRNPLSFIDFMKKITPCSKKQLYFEASKQEKMDQKSEGAELPTLNTINVAISSTAAASASVDDLTEGEPDCLGEIESSEESDVFDIDPDGIGTGESASEYMDDD